MDDADKTPPLGRRPRFATAWLGGCSGCHMSFLDLDERLIAVAAIADLVFSPFMDVKEFPEDVDVVLVEGAIANDEHLDMIRKIRERSRSVVSFGDCAITGNVTAMRNPLRLAAPVLERSYADPANRQPQIPKEPGIVPVLVDQVLPLHHVVRIDYFLPGCPPSADLIFYVVGELLVGRAPVLTDNYHFG